MWIFNRMNDFITIKLLSRKITGSNNFSGIIITSAVKSKVTWKNVWNLVSWFFTFLRNIFGGFVGERGTSCLQILRVLVQQIVHFINNNFHVVFPENWTLLQGFRVSEGFLELGAGQFLSPFLGTIEYCCCEQEEKYNSERDNQNCNGS